MVHVLLGREALCARVYRVQQGIALLCWGAVLLCLGADAHQVMYAPMAVLPLPGTSLRFVTRDKSTDV